MFKAASIKSAWAPLPNPIVATNIMQARNFFNAVSFSGAGNLTSLVARDFLLRRFFVAVASLSEFLVFRITYLVRTLYEIRFTLVVLSFTCAE
jgi:hypothetical protein